MPCDLSETLNTILVSRLLIPNAVRPLSQTKDFGPLTLPIHKSEAIRVVLLRRADMVKSREKMAKELFESFQEATAYQQKYLKEQEKIFETDLAIERLDKAIGRLRDDDQEGGGNMESDKATAGPSAEDEEFGRRLEITEAIARLGTEGWESHDRLDGNEGEGMDDTEDNDQASFPRDSGLHSTGH